MDAHLTLVVLGWVGTQVSKHALLVVGLAVSHGQSSNVLRSLLFWSLEANRGINSVDISVDNGSGGILDELLEMIAGVGVVVL